MSTDHASPPTRWRWLGVLLPLLVVLAVLLTPTPPGLAPHAWRYFAVFAGVLVALVLEPWPNATVGLIGVIAVAAFSRFTLFSEAQMAAPGFDAPARALDWALGGFRNSAVWLAFSAFMLGLGYEQTGLGRRIALAVVRRMGGGALRLGYAVVLVDLILAPFTPSNTARSAGTVYPIVRNLPPLYGSHPDSASAADLGRYLMWTAFLASCVTSALFLTALAPNLIAAELIASRLGFDVGWLDWFAVAASFGVPLLLVLPPLALRLCPPRSRESPEVVRWAGAELGKLGPLSRNETLFAALAVSALLLWIFGGKLLHPATVGMAVMALLPVLRITTWDAMIGHRAAWDMLLRLALLVTLAEGLNSTGFIAWFAALVGESVSGRDPVVTMAALVAIYFVSHYLFATTTAHATAVMPVMLGVGLAVPGLPALPFALLLAFSHGLMGVMSPYATGPAPVYHGSGYLPGPVFWRLGAVCALLFLAALLALGLPAALYYDTLR